MRFNNEKKTVVRDGSQATSLKEIVVARSIMKRWKKGTKKRTQRERKKFIPIFYFNNFLCSLFFRFGGCELKYFHTLSHSPFRSTLTKRPQLFFILVLTESLLLEGNSLEMSSDERRTLMGKSTFNEWTESEQELCSFFLVPGLKVADEVQREGE